MNEWPDFECVVKLYDPLIKKYLMKYHLVYDFQEYQQIARIALWEAYLLYDPNKGAFPAFASMMVRSQLITEIRKRKKYSEKQTLTDKIPEQVMGETVAMDRTEAILSTSILSRREKDWLEAAIIQDQSTKEIAAHYQVTQDTVRSWKKSAIKKLRQQLAINHNKN